MSSSCRIYLDHAASSFPKPPEVARAVARAISECAGNPGRGSHASAMSAARVVHDARRAVASLVGISDARDLIFQPSCTQALNLALFGLLGPGDRVVVSSMEHNSIVRPLHALARFGVDVAVVEADKTGLLDPESVRDVLRAAPTRALVVQHASNVGGTIQPIAELAEIARESGTRILVDGAQAGGHLEVEMDTLGVDAWACAGHKGLLGPHGTGVLCLAADLDLDPLVYGGTGSESEMPDMPAARPDRYEAGTQNVPGIAGLAEAVRMLVAEAPRLRTVESSLAARLHEGLEALGFRVLGPPLGVPRVPVISVVHPSVEPARIAFELDRAGIAVRSGLHCAPWAHRTLGSLETGAVRFSIGIGLTSDDIDEAIGEVRSIVTERS